MSLSTVRVRRSKSDKNPVEVTYDFGENVDESVKMFDGMSSLDKVVHGLFVIAAKQQLQDFVRGLIAQRKLKPPKKSKKGLVLSEPEAKAPLTADEIQAKVDQWRPTVERAAKRTVDKVAKVVSNLSDEERMELMRKLGITSPPERLVPRGVVIGKTDDGA